MVRPYGELGREGTPETRIPRPGPAAAPVTVPSRRAGRGGLCGVDFCDGVLARHMNGGTRQVCSPQHNESANYESNTEHRYLPLMSTMHGFNSHDGVQQGAAISRTTSSWPGCMAETLTCGSATLCSISRGAAQECFRCCRTSHTRSNGGSIAHGRKSAFSTRNRPVLPCGNDFGFRSRLPRCPRKIADRG
jgi:hypothetical protein